MQCESEPFYGRTHLELVIAVSEQVVLPLDAGQQLSEKVPHLEGLTQVIILRERSWEAVG